MTDRTIDPGADLGAALAAHAGESPGHGRTRVVTLMKRVLPVVAAVIVGLVVVWAQGGGDEGFRLSLSNPQPGEAGRSGMVNARFIGMDEKDQPYVLTAESVVPEDGGRERFALDTVQADLALGDGGWLSLASPRGVYDRGAARLSLEGSVDVFSAHGYELHTRALDIDLATGTASGDQPLQGHGPLGAIEAQRFRFEHATRRLLFEGGVRMTINPPAAE